MVDEDDESALYIDETSQITEDMLIGDDDDIEEEDMDFEEDLDDEDVEEEIGGFPEEFPMKNDESIRDKVFIMKVPESQLPAGTSIKKIPSASDTTSSNQSLQVIKFPNPNIVTIKEVPKVNFLFTGVIFYVSVILLTSQENMGIKMVSPKGMNFTLISKKPIVSPVSKGEFVPILPKLIPAPMSGNFTTTITSAGVGPIRSAEAPSKIIKVNTGESVFKTFIGATVITQKPMPQLQPAQSLQISSFTSGPTMVRPVTIKPISNTQSAPTMTITKGPSPQQTISVADSSKITISKEVSSKD